MLLWALECESLIISLHFEGLGDRTNANFVEFWSPKKPGTLFRGISSSRHLSMIFMCCLATYLTVLLV